MYQMHFEAQWCVFCYVFSNLLQGWGVCKKFDLKDKFGA